MSKRKSGHAVRQLVANQRAKRLACWLCGQPIDYGADKDDDDSFSYDHFHPVSTHPHLEMDPANGRSAHLRCNKSRGNRAPKPDLGTASERW